VGGTSYSTGRYSLPPAVRLRQPANGQPPPQCPYGFVYRPLRARKAYLAAEAATQSRPILNVTFKLTHYPGPVCLDGTCTGP
jgi:hypothetical protein